MNRHFLEEKMINSNETLKEDDPANQELLHTEQPFDHPPEEQIGD